MKTHCKNYNWILLPLLIILMALQGCSNDDENKRNDGVGKKNNPGGSTKCVVTTDKADFSEKLGCVADFKLLASTTPVSTSTAKVPGVSVVKVLLDRPDNNKIYYQNTRKYEIHWEFARKFLSGNGKPIVPDLDQFFNTEYSSPDRRFIAGSLNYYTGANVYVFAIDPEDTADATMIATAYQAIVDSSFIGSDVYFHPTSAAIARVAKELPSTVNIITTDELYKGVEYQALNVGTSMGKLRFLKAEDLDKEYIHFRDIVVLDYAPNNIPVSMGIITEKFQTPLSHVNILAQNRGTPNMALKGASDNTTLRALEGSWVKLQVMRTNYSIERVSQEEADQWWDTNKPKAIQVPNLDLSVTGFHDIENLLDPQLDLEKSIKLAIPAFGGKSSHYAAAAKIGENVPMPKAFSIPVFYYWQFMEQNQFHEQIQAMLADVAFKNDPSIRKSQLKALRKKIKTSPVDSDFETLLLAKLATDYLGTRMRFRSSSNAEDLDGFTGAGLYTSKSGDPNDPKKPVLDAVRKVWASLWSFRAFEERAYRSIDHSKVGMAILVHRSFPDEEANGVALTQNPNNINGSAPGFVVNVQAGEASVVKPDPDVTTDHFIYNFDHPDKTITFITHSNLIPEGEVVLNKMQTLQLGRALKAIHEYFKSVYGTDPERHYAMDVEFKFDGKPGEEPALFVKQARPHLVPKKKQHDWYDD